MTKIGHKRKNIQKKFQLEYPIQLERKKQLVKKGSLEIHAFYLEDRKFSSDVLIITQFRFHNKRKKLNLYKKFRRKLGCNIF